MDSILISYPSCSFRLYTTTSSRRFKKLKTTPCHFSLSTIPQKSTSLWQKYTSPIKSFSVFRSVLHGIKKLDEKTSMNQWVSALPGYAASGSETIPYGFSCNYLHNGGFGMALLSVTSTAKLRISPFVATLAANPTFVSGFFAWLIAQSMKVFLHFCVEKKLDFRIMCASGGMPSSHSALCTALTTAVAICHGVADSLFPVCLGFSLIVMYDAIGVRRHAGMQAEVLNLIVEDLFQGHPISKRKLKELLGHTPLQVVAGAVLGFLVACICCRVYFVAV